MILPKDRDPRFITIRRGGTLTDSDHQLLALWAADVRGARLHLFESAADCLTRDRVRRSTRPAHGCVARSRCLRLAQRRAPPMQRARDLSGAARHAAHAAGQAAAVAHVAAHELGAAAYAIKAARAAAPDGEGEQRRSARVPVAARAAAGGDSRARPRRPAVAQRHLLVGVRLLVDQCVQGHCPTRRPEKLIQVARLSEPC